MYNLNWFQIILPLFMALVFLASVYRTYRREAKVTAAYRLYKVRDDILYELINGRIKEDSLIATFLYRNLNGVLTNKEYIRMKYLVQRVPPLNPELQTKIATLRAEIKDGGPHVQAIAEGYFFGFKKLLVANSSSLRIAILLGKFVPRERILQLLIMTMDSLIKVLHIKYFGYKEEGYKAYVEVDKCETQLVPAYA